MARVDRSVKGAGFAGDHELWVEAFAITSGAPPFAPMLFVNIALLGGIALHALWPHVPEQRR